MTMLNTRIRNKINRLYGQLACRLFPNNWATAGRLTRNTFAIGKNMVDIQYRIDNLGDCGVIDQVFHCHDYQVGIWPHGKALIAFYDKQAKDKTPLIIDAGANIGASCLYFSAAYPKARLVAIEPEKHNCKLLRLNSRNSQIQVHEAALGNKPGKLFLQDPGMSSWGFRVGEHGDYAVQVITVEQILQDAPADHIPFILKIDIEGGEQSLFDAECEWLARFALVVIELHDWMLPGIGSSNNFLKSLSKHNFDIMYRGENMFCFNNKVLAAHY